MRNIFKTTVYSAIALGMGLANSAMAFEPGDWLVRVGVTSVEPKSNNHEVVSVDSAATTSINFTYMMTDIWAVEVLAAVPFEHDLRLLLDDPVLGNPIIGSTKHLSPTVSLQYHFRPTSKFQPYWGIGINYTQFFSKKTTGPLEGTKLDLDCSWGLVGQIGFDVLLGENMFFNVDARYANIETEAKINGESLGTVKIDPMVYGAHFGFRF